MNRYTAYIAWPGTPPGTADEEIDVDANSEAEAHTMAEAELAKNYEPGGRIVWLTKQEGWYL